MSRAGDAQKRAAGGPALRGEKRDFEAFCFAF